MDSELQLGQQLVAGTLDLLCPEMSLASTADPDTPLAQGCGMIKSNGRGQLEFAFAGSTRQAVNALLQVQANGSGDNGLVVRACDLRGWRWESQNHIQSFSTPIGGNGWPHVSGRLRMLVGSRRVFHTHAPSYELLIPNRPRLPMDGSKQVSEETQDGQTRKHFMIDRHVGAIGDVQTRFVNLDDDWLQIVGVCNEAIGPDWPYVVEHAIGYVFGCQARAAVVVERDGSHESITLLSGPHNNTAFPMRRPIVEGDPSHWPHLWNLLERVTTWLLASKDRPSLVTELAAAREGSAMSLSTGALTAAVAVEALAGLVIEDRGSDGWNRTAKEELAEFIGGWSGDAATRDRVLKWLQSSSQTRAVDRLYAWADREGVDRQLVDDWKRLRNPRAHGRLMEGSQREVQWYYSAVVLLHRIVAYATGYSGPLSTHPCAKEMGLDMPPGG